jgi:hypothetical protein
LTSPRSGSVQQAGPFCRSSIKPGSIAARPLGSQKTKKQRDGLDLIVEGVLDNPAVCADPAPTPDKTNLPEQRLLDRQGIEAGHILVRVSAFDIEAILLHDHADRIAQPVAGVQ